MHFDARRLFGICAQSLALLRFSELKGDGPFVFDSADLPAHERAEQRVHKMKDRFGTAPILGQRPNSAFCSLAAPSFHVTVEDARVGESESVNALFHVTHQEAVRLGAL